MANKTETDREATKNLLPSQLKHYRIIVAVLRSRTLGRRDTVHVLEVRDYFNDQTTTQEIIRAYQWACDITGGKMGVSTTAGLNSAYHSRMTARQFAARAEEYGKEN